MATVTLERATAATAAPNSAAQQLRVAQDTFIRRWGEMGATGYKGTDPRFINYNKEDDFDVSSQSHLDIFFVKEKLDFFGPLIVKAVVENAG